MSMPPNIVLVMTDQQRWDSVSMAGVFPPATPVLDELARDGVWFPYTYCQSPVCVPSRMSFLSGRYVHQHGCVDNDSILWPDAPSFVRELQHVGYHTANIGKLHYTWQHDLEILASEHLLNRLGFAEPLETTGKMSRGNLRVSAYSEHLRAKGLLADFHRDLLQRAEASPLAAYRMRPSILTDDDHLDSWILNRSADWIVDNDSYPFFLWVGPEGPHDPFDPPEPYASTFQPSDMPTPIDHDPGEATPGTIARRVPDDVTTSQLQEMATQYLGNVAQIDAGVGRILQALDRQGQLDNTWVVFTSDHGEMLGDHRLLFKTQLYEPAVRVPLVIRSPTTAVATRGSRSDALVELIDLTATILAIAGAALDGHQGRDLLPLVEGAGSASTHRDAVTSVIGPLTMIRMAEWKLVAETETLTPRFLWNLQDDPHERVNLIPTAAPTKVIRDLLDRIAALAESAPADLPEPWRHIQPYQYWTRNPLRER